MPSLAARAPTRLDFGGGWTDVPPYPMEKGGFVCNVAISRYARVHLSDASASDRSANDRERALADAALRVSGLTGVRADVQNEFPTGAGLGGSSAAGVAMMGAIEAWRALAATGSSLSSADAGRLSALRRAIPANRTTLAESSRRVEVEELGIAGGRQDHYAAAYGGALALTFEETTGVRRLALSENMVHALESRCVVLYTGVSRISGETITAVLNAYGARERRVVDALERMKRLAMQMADAIESDDLDALGALVGEHWQHQRALHPAITTPEIDQILDVATVAGALGGKALGASGGGCVLLVARQGREGAVRDALAPLGTILPFHIDREGFSWWIEPSPLLSAAP